MPQIYMIITPHAENILKDSILSLESELISTVEKEFDLEGLNDVAFTIPPPVLYTKGEANVQIEIRYTAGEDEYNRGKPFNPSLKEQEKLAERIKETFLGFLRRRNLIWLTLSVWCKPYYHSFFKAFE